MKLLVTVTMPDSQLRAHLLPLASLQEVEEILLVTDRAPERAIEKVRPIVPPPALTRVVGRAAAKLMVLLPLARRTRPEWIISFSLMPHAVNARLAALVSGARFMAHSIGGPPEWKEGGWKSENSVLGRLPFGSRALEQLWVRLYGSADALIVMGSNAREALVAAGLPSGRAYVVPPSVDSDRFVPTHGDAPDYDLITVARLVPVKRQADLLRAVARLRVHRPGLRTAIVGDGPLARELSELADHLGVSDAVDFLGHRNDVEQLHRRARIFVLTSESESLSVAMTEAMSSGLPVVATRVGDLQDLVVPGSTGALVEVGDLAEISAEIGGLLDRRDLLAEMSAAARLRAVEHSSVQRVAEIYRRILLEPDSPTTAIQQAPKV